MYKADLILGPGDTGNDIRLGRGFRGGFADMYLYPLCVPSGLDLQLRRQRYDTADTVIPPPPPPVGDTRLRMLMGAGQ